MKSSLIKTIALGSLLTCSAAVMADTSDYKLMVIEQATAPQPIEQSFNSCALNVKSKNYAEAEAICTKAIALLKDADGPKFKVRQLTSFALSNRGVARLKSNNDTAAIADLYEAAQMSNSTMVSHNLTLAKEELAL
ncbi:MULTISPECIES: hypothetical protein [Pseudoalteromonas]|jgi:hypothetical protein|uniref:Orphan protein n=1 Tax=Pseudoalteromonas agarivorans TaxID=176102 RepID=A0AAD0TYY3_9GAMM|nr:MULTISPECIES: hypothetical protein [Pseudoalteromonas]MCP4056724.1 hypothetical protein [Pseudoalteromonas sp.]AYM86898.1 hypothetical protein D9T18_09360 [Pseudoalteromonas agarivorans]ENN99347.1 hypothetical protein J139_07637 [Pseudoalteromonas agarivorans S816]KPV97533.1 hypothetical protein AN390_03826 [Pseudoalteromonas sp. P1-11]MCK8106325.1 hypothetical protein [Pseudoalteromonas sp. 2CM41L]|tara:strand:+ start:620 stop:1027 length:408 start_codon:yes stop_codon:yes gene_type:complete